MDAAASLFAKKGMAAVSIRELSLAANVNSSLISYYFGGKNELYVAILEEQFAPVIETLEIAASIPHLSPVERLQYYAKTIISLQLRHPLLKQLLNNELIHPTSNGHIIVQKYLALFFQFIRATLEAGIVAENFKFNLNMTCAEVFWYAIFHCQISSFPVYCSQQLEQNYVEQTLDLYLNGVAKNTVHYF